MYAADHVARPPHPETDKCPNVSTQDIAAFQKNKEMYSKQPPKYFLRAMRKVLLEDMVIIRALQVAVLKDYVAMLREERHRVKITLLAEKKIKLVRKKIAQFIFRQKQLAEKTEKENVFNEKCVKLEDIENDARYYGGFLLVPSTLAHFVRPTRVTTCAYAAHWREAGLQPYGTTF